MIRLENLTKTFSSVTAVNSISLEIRPGEIFGFLGPNGAGKTTTIKMMAGLIKPTSGDIYIKNWKLSTHPQQAKQLCGFIPDRPFLYGKLTGREFLGFMARLYNVSALQTGQRANQLFELFEMTDYCDDLIESYSHGMKQRLVMAGSLIHKPAALIVDEPMVGLDPRGARLVRKLFRELCNSGAAVFMSTHTLEIAEEMCDRIGIIQDGQLIAVGTMKELREASGSQAERLEPIFFRLTGDEALGKIADSLQL
jgi:ABC-2 type transport system ATP-binding protein